jgi:hypothetical protein
MIEKLLAAVVLAVCVVFLVRLMLGARRQHQLDAAARRAGARVRHVVHAMWHWRSSRKRAQRMADDAIRRAASHDRGDGHWDGNVFKPKSFRRPRKPH